jgi:hypothetical protein
MTSTQRLRNQKGSALMIVFVFAAIVAIMLYNELPVAVFEAKRRKEELLMDRGNEYAHAIKLYVRKFQTFPASIDALEHTNRMRFLRSRYVDPYTGKDDWRVLHAGPGGVIIDSKIKKQNSGPNGTPGANSTATSSAGFGSLGSSGFGGSGFASNNQSAQSTQSAQAALTNGFPQIANNNPPVVPATNPALNTDGSDPSQTSPDGTPAAVVGPQPNLGRKSSNNINYATGSLNGLTPQQMAQQLGIDPSTNPQDVQAMMQALLTTPNPTSQTLNGPQGAASGGGSNNNNNGNTLNGGGATQPQPAVAAGTPQNVQGNLTAGGGIAGVASKTSGRTVKVFNDQTDISLWEFVYDMNKERMANAPQGIGGSGTSGSTGANTGINGNQNNQGSSFGFGSSNQNSGFGAPSSTPPPPPTPSNP